ncbi:glutamine--tRNA ligase [Peribacillus deserti]|uniref:Glutamine--tRNA ligase n=1 Tax=Peribacillus deserti TaxID=673318 RepID=A0A2N5M1B4_9BACI|nr:glutamine--tRNA ligase [Peribacillus deserti]
MSNEDKNRLSDGFLDLLTENDFNKGTFQRPICTRFPPEPNGYLHIGSAYAIHINYTAAKKYDGHFNLRFDDTNPLKEDIEYVNSIIEDIHWLGYTPGGRIFFGSDYSREIYDAAAALIRRGKAYVCDLSPEEIASYRGTLTEPGINSPYRNRTADENLDLFSRMKDGDFPTASRVLRAKIDMASPNMNLRDPVLYRIIHAEHYRTGHDWCVYPMYDFAHPIQDAIEGVTHSLCSIEFKDHRPLYEWVLTQLEITEAPKQREFGRVNVTGVITSKRYLRELVSGHVVEGWDDPRLPTIRGLRRRGFTPESIRDFVHQIGFVRHQSTVDYSLLENSLRNDLKTKAKNVMAVLHPLKVTITNYEEGKTELLPIENNSENPELGSRKVPFSRVIYIEKEDFMEVPAKGFKRLSLHSEVRLKGAYFIRCNEVVKNEAGEVIELKCTYDINTKSGTGFTGRKVKGTIHWVSARHCRKAEVRLFNPLLKEPDSDVDGEIPWGERINPLSKIVIQNCFIEDSIKNDSWDNHFQFIRHGYFCLDRDSSEESYIFNRTVPLKDSWKGKSKNK